MNTNTTTTKPRRWFRFRLRTLLVMVTLSTVVLGWVGWELDQRRSEKEVGSVTLRNQDLTDLTPLSELKSFEMRAALNPFTALVASGINLEPKHRRDRIQPSYR